MDEFNGLLRDLGWNRREFAKRAGYHPNTVSGWKRPPKIVLAYLRLKANVKCLGA